MNKEQQKVRPYGRELVVFEITPNKLVYAHNLVFQDYSNVTQIICGLYLYKYVGRHLLWIELLEKSFPYYDPVSTLTAYHYDTKTRILKKIESRLRETTDLNLKKILNGASSYRHIDKLHFLDGKFYFASRQGSILCLGLSI